MIDFESTNQTKKDAIMKTFEDYYWCQFDVLNKDTQLARQFGQDVWDFQQAKIDELQARIDATEKWIESNKKNIPLSEWHGYTTEEYVDADDLLEILKGNKDEN